MSGSLLTRSKSCPTPCYKNVTHPATETTYQDKHCRMIPTTHELSDKPDVHQIEHADDARLPASEDVVMSVDKTGEVTHSHDKKWERKTVAKVDLRLLVIRESLYRQRSRSVGLCYAVSLM